MTGSLGRELAPEQRCATHDADHRQARDQPRVEPVLSLAVLEHVLQRADTHGEQRDADVVDAPGALLVSSDHARTPRS